MMMNKGNANEKKEVVIFYPSIMYQRLYFARISIDTLLRRKKKFEPRFGSLPDGDGNRSYYPGANTVVCHNKLYVIGGINISEKRVINTVNSYSLHKSPPIKEDCLPMKICLSRSLACQVGCYVYVIGFQNKKLVVQKLEMATGDWFIDYEGDINGFRFDKWVCDNFQSAPHVLIDNKLHISFGNCSFSYDIGNHAWEVSHLFDTFWGTNHISPSNFYGGSVWGDYSRRTNVAGQPFGFRGKGILWDNNILLGIHYALDCALMAFKLENGVAVDFQRVTLNDLGLNANDDRFGLNGVNRLSLGASIVDLGRDHFTLVHFVYDHIKMPSFIPSEHFCMELVTFKVSRTSNGLLNFKSVRKDSVRDDKFQRDVYNNYYACSLY